MHFDLLRFAKPLLPVMRMGLSLCAPLAIAAEPLQSIPACALVKVEWSDGDSFPIQTPDGKTYTVRLYGADCLEWHVTDATDVRRLSDQRRYFGIAELGGSPLASIQAAKDFGAQAASCVAECLANPFTVHTSFADARGDGKHKRIYAFITTADGKDLASELVARGLARAFGVSHTTPDGKNSKDFAAQLDDLEMQAASLRKGIWAKTDWAKLPAERKAQRDDDAEIDLALGKSPDALAQPIDPNTAARDELIRLPGIGEEMANRIIEQRPYRQARDLLNVPGIGKATLKRLLPHLKFTAASSSGHPVGM